LKYPYNQRFKRTQGKRAGFGCFAPKTVLFVQKIGAENPAPLKRETVGRQ
jgi:hypothetical protein